MAEATPNFYHPDGKLVPRDMTLLPEKAEWYTKQIRIADAEHERSPRDYAPVGVSKMREINDDAWFWMSFRLNKYRSDGRNGELRKVIWDTSGIRGQDGYLNDTPYPFRRCVGLNLPAPAWIRINGAQRENKNIKTTMIMSKGLLIQNENREYRSACLELDVDGNPFISEDKPLHWHPGVLPRDVMIPNGATMAEAFETDTTGFLPLYELHPRMGVELWEVLINPQDGGCPFWLFGQRLFLMTPEPSVRWNDREMAARHPDYKKQSERISWGLRGSTRWCHTGRRWSASMTCDRVRMESDPLNSRDLRSTDCGGPDLTYWGDAWVPRNKKVYETPLTLGNYPYPDRDTPYFFSEITEGRMSYLNPHLYLMTRAEARKVNFTALRQVRELGDGMETINIGSDYISFYQKRYQKQNRKNNILEKNRCGDMSKIPAVARFLALGWSMSDDKDIEEKLSIEDGEGSDSSSGDEKAGVGSPAKRRGEDGDDMGPEWKKERMTLTEALSVSPPRAVSQSPACMEMEWERDDNTGEIFFAERVARISPFPTVMKVESADEVADCFPPLENESDDDGAELLGAETFVGERGGEAPNEGIETVTPAPTDDSLERLERAFSVLSVILEDVRGVVMSVVKEGLTPPQGASDASRL
ncbi:uncharacterized protein LOC114467210 [Gouania willdenowi]|uniref:uncharacterized protein LOC114467210 n=2 Tax=Gouania willdenowi TaxID=441366 RepID=UPI001056615E|nr:uncharacterized protein LOC114467210 [Gouania willdenowi]